jgi:hypothetical protein
MLRIRFANNSHHTFAGDDLAMLTAFFNRCLDFHCRILKLFVSIRDAPFCKIIRRKLNCHLITFEDLNEVHPHLP